MVIVHNNIVYEVSWEKWVLSQKFGSNYHLFAIQKGKFPFSTPDSGLFPFSLLIGVPAA